MLDPDGRLVDARTYHPGWVFHGLLVSRASSVAQFLDLVATGALLHPEDRSALLDCVPVAAEHPRLVPGYGLGVMADSRAPEACFGHDGGGPGFTAAAWHLNGEAGVASVCVILASEADHAAESLLFETATEAGFAPPTPASSS